LAYLSLSVLGHYRLTRLLGQGGFAEVYLGEHIDLGTQAAIKILHTRVVEEDVALFRQEARLLASLRHPHIVRVLDFGVSEQTPYLVMDYAPHGTLRTRYARGTPLPVSTVVNYVKQIAQALQYAHDRKVIHRDIKPENMLIGEKNEILLSDFGIALIAQSSHYQSTKDMAGTIAYMAPEQISAHPRPQSDQYSLGIVVYEWFSGTLPFHGTLAEIAIKHSVTPPPPLRDRLATFSSDLEQVIFTALAKRPEERFASVIAFATALEQASQDVLLTEQSRPLGSSSLLSPPPPTDALTLPPITATVLASSPDQPSERAVTTRTQLNQSVPMPATEVPKPAKTTLAVSRRAVLTGVAGAAAIVAVGAGAFAILQQHLLGPTVTPPGQTVIPQAPTGTPFIYRGHSDKWVRTLAWSPDSKRIASGADDKTVQVWNASDGGNVFTYTGHSGTVWSVAWSPDGKRIASGSSDQTVQVWNASDGGNVFTYREHSNTASTGTDILVSQSSSLEVLGNPRYRLIGSYSHPRMPLDLASNPGTLRAAWSPDGKRIASGSWDRTVQVWNASDGGNVFTYTGHSGTVWSVAWSQDGKRIASGSWDRTVQVWNASDGGNVFTYTGHSNDVLEVAWSPDGKRIASSSHDKTVQVWNASNGGNVFTYTGHSAGVLGVAWSPDGKRIASSSWDGTVQVWNASNGGNVFTYRGHSANVEAVAWSPDGKRIVSSSEDKTVQVWNVE
jgi:WD40 repeat protein/serine/threonine protein kinase